MLNHKAKYRREHALTEHQTLKTVEKALNVSVLHIARILTKIIHCFKSGYFIEKNGTVSTFQYSQVRTSIILN